MAFFPERILGNYRRYLTLYLMNVTFLAFLEVYNCTVHFLFEVSIT